MSQTKVQLIAPIGVVTASTLETTGVLTATTFVGDIAGTVTGITSTTDNLNLGIITATSFAGDFTGIGSGLTGTPNVVAGVVTATKFVGNTPGLVSGIADGTNINAGIITATSFVGNLTGNAAGLSTTTGHANLGIVTATSFHGSGANLDGVSSGPVAQQAVTANSSTTTIDLSSGNLIYMTQSANTTVAFANTEGNTDVVYLVRTKDDNTTARTITWPSGFVWNGGTEPTLLNSSLSGDAQVFKLTTRDNGATWYGVEVVKNGSGYELFTWAFNTFGELGQSDRERRSSPTQVGSESLWTKIIGKDESRSFGGLKSDGTIWLWGRVNAKGGLGQNSTATSQYSSPVQAGGGSDWIDFTIGTSNEDRLVFATKSDNTLWAWGDNESGQLGHNNTTNYSSPVQIPGTTWTSNVMGGDYVSLGVKTDGTLWAWGYNGYGQLGQNQPHTTKYSSPIQIPGTTWREVWVSQATVMATKTDNTLWSWGYNHLGQLGLNGLITGGSQGISSPTQVPGTTWKSAQANTYHGMGVKTDGTLWAWGNNGSGQLGQNSVNSPGPSGGISSPVQIPGTSWDISSTIKYSPLRSSSSFAIKTDGTLWAWGSSSYGKLGLSNVTTEYSSPVQIPGTNWISVVSGSYSVGGLKS